MNGTFEMAQALRKSHCDRRGDESHECVGEMTIKRGEICLNCKLCGKGEEIPEGRVMRDEIEVDDEEGIQGKVFRVFTRKNGACNRSLAVRISWTGDGWQCSFHEWIRDAAGNVEPIAVSFEHADLAAFAIQEFKNFVHEWELESKV